MLVKTTSANDKSHNNIIYFTAASSWAGENIHNFIGGDYEVVLLSCLQGGQPPSQFINIRGVLFIGYYKSIALMIN